MREALLQRAQALAARLPGLGIGPDLAALPLADLWGVYRFLLRLAQET
ncbi:MAG TPA: hypothetical protein PLA97_05560 [Rubrivivax sp.]|nr:hypothetical protein [Rubrivivax sp.]